jgi:hypothetical protein
MNQIKTIEKGFQYYGWTEYVFKLIKPDFQIIVNYFSFLRTKGHQFYPFK